jgi:hypothetical protein
MILSCSRFLAATAAFIFLGCAAASADCNPGDLQCQGGYRYICKCWTTTGCQYERDSGYCHNDDRGAPSATNFNLLNKHILQARLVCGSSVTAAAIDSCTGH